MCYSQCIKIIHYPELGCRRSGYFGINVPCRVLQTVKTVGVISTQDTALSAFQGSRVNHVMRVCYEEVITCIY